MEKEQIKEQTRERVRRHRALQKSVTENRDVTQKPPNDVTGCNAIIPAGVNLYRYRDGKREELKEVPEGYQVLSDGQVWKPLFHIEMVEIKESLDEHPVMKYLVPGAKRGKMEGIVLSLKKFNVLDCVDLGVVPMTTVADYLEATVKI